MTDFVAETRRGRVFPGRRGMTKCPNWAEFPGFVLNAPLSSATGVINRPVWLGVYTRAMMITRILTIGAAVAAAAAGVSLAEISLAQAQQGYLPPPPGYSAAPPYPPG